MWARAAWSEDRYVFATVAGAALDSTNVRRDFRKVLAKIDGLTPEEWTPRELRHSFVSVLSDNGVAIEEIARLAGHASSRTTEVVYRKQLRRCFRREPQSWTAFSLPKYQARRPQHDRNSLRVRSPAAPTPVPNAQSVPLSRRIRLAGAEQRSARSGHVARCRLPAPISAGTQPCGPPKPQMPPSALAPTVSTMPSQDESRHMKARLGLLRARGSNRLRSTDPRASNL
jgi:hypothetical protein